MIFGWAWSNIAVAFVILESLKLLYFKYEFMNWTDFLNADSDAVIVFG